MVLSLKVNTYNNIYIHIENDPPLPCHRKLLSPPPSTEMVFRPSLKRVQSQTTYVERPQGLKIVPKPNRLSSARPEGKKSYFPYRIERAEKEKKLLKEMKTENFIHDEFRLLQHIGFVKKDYSTIPNRHLMNLTFVRDQFNSLRMDDDFNTYVNEPNVKNIKGYNDLTIKQKREIQKKITLNKKQQLNKDMKYVFDLNKWENKNFPKVSKPVINNNNNNEVNNVEEPIINDDIPNTNEN